MIRIETVDELLAVDVLLIGRASVPEMRMPVDYENLFALRSPVHGVSPELIGFVRLAIGGAGLALAGIRTGQALPRCHLQEIYFMTSFMSPNSTTVLSSVITMRP